MSDSPVFGTDPLEGREGELCVKTDYVLVDFENVQPKNMKLLRERTCQIKIFVGTNQKIPFEVAEAIQAFGSDAEYIKIEGEGKNSLDFHIAYYIGRLTAESSDTHFHIVSKDTGFDPLIRHIKKRKINCERTATVEEISLLKPGPDSRLLKKQVKDVVERLSNGTKPRTEKKLISTIKSVLSKPLSEERITKIVRELGESGVITITDGKIIYSLPS